MSNWVGRLFSLQPAAIGSAAAALYAAGAMIYRAEVAHTGVFQPDLIVAAFTLLWGLFTHVKVTPLGRPRDAEGRALVPRRENGTSRGPSV